MIDRLIAVSYQLGSLKSEDLQRPQNRTSGPWNSPLYGRPSLEEFLEALGVGIRLAHGAEGSSRKSQQSSSPRMRSSSIGKAKLPKLPKRSSNSNHQSSVLHRDHTHTPNPTLAFTPKPSAPHLLHPIDLCFALALLLLYIFVYTYVNTDLLLVSTDVDGVLG